MKATMILIPILFTVACGGGGDDPECLLTGTYDLSHFRDSGNCDDGLAEDNTLYVSASRRGYVVVDEDGTPYDVLEADEGSCTLLLSYVGEPADGMFVDVIYDLAVDGELVDGFFDIELDDLTGVAPDLTCSGGYEVVGSIQ